MPRAADVLRSDPEYANRPIKTTEGGLGYDEKTDGVFHISTCRNCEVIAPVRR